MEPTQFPIQSICGGFLIRRKAAGLTGHLIHLVPTLRMSGGFPPLLHGPSWRAQQYHRLYSTEQRPLQNVKAENLGKNLRAF
jgi:hypothetical protein